MTPQGKQGHEVGMLKPEEFLENKSQSSLLGKGHLTCFLSFGLGLSVTGIEADPTLVSMASKYDGQLLWTLEKERQRKVMHQNCSSTEVVVCPVEEGQGCPDFVLTGLHACGDLRVTLLLHFASCPHIHGVTSVACCYMKITTS
uniref:Methyltransferase domain-containing protein n=1 Tax=Oncorhynchus tshawytscha TaxID=74940 RepID=A0A8C8CMA8_ONCTS